MQNAPTLADIVAFVKTLPHTRRKPCAAPETYDDRRPDGWPGWGALVSQHGLPKTAAGWHKLIESGSALEVAN